MASAYLLVPIKTDTLTFFRKRSVRVVVPVLVFLALYAVLPSLWGAQTWSQAWVELRHAYINFPVSGSHLWFVYMLIGLYMLMPVLSPWLANVSKKEEQIYLGIWLFTSIFYRLRPMLGGAIFGECWWGVNAARTYINWDKRRVVSICAPLFIVTFAILLASGAYYSTRCTTPAELEQDWQFLSLIPVVMSFSSHMPEYFGIPLIAISTYLTSFVISHLIAKLPFGKYIVG